MVKIFPEIHCAFRVQTRSALVSENPLKWDIRSARQVPVAKASFEETEQFVPLATLPEYVVNKVTLLLDDSMKKAQGKTRRSRVAIGFVPIVVCCLTYDRRPFNVIIAGAKKSILLPGWVPGSKRRRLGRALGVPCAVASTAGLAASVVALSTGSISGLAGGALAGIGALCLIGSMGYILWAVFSMPKPHVAAKQGNT